MQSNILSRFSLVSGIVFFTGCAHVNNPWEDSSAVINQHMRTASADAYKGQPEFGRTIQRAWSPSNVTYQNGSVTHWPLWFEDPFEVIGNRDRPYDNPEAERDLADNRFAVTWVDYFHMAYGPAREFVNIVGWPVSAVVEYPGKLMESDGRLSKSLLGYDRDPKPADSATREPPHMSYLEDAYAHPEREGGADSLSPPSTPR